MARYLVRRKKGGRVSAQLIRKGVRVKKTPKQYYFEKGDLWRAVPRTKNIKVVRATSSKAAMLKAVPKPRKGYKWEFR